jgi:predicted  nucleic acid-binding Zn-ribbon protein
LDIKYLDELENKVQTLLVTLENVRRENDRLKGELTESSSKISAIESENNQLSQELSALKTAATDQKGKLDLVTERIQNILTRLDSVG